MTAGVGTWDCKRKLKLKGNRFGLTLGCEKRRGLGWLGLGHKERFVLADSAGLGQASLGSVSRKYFLCLIPGHRIVIRHRYRTLNAFTG